MEAADDDLELLAALWATPVGRRWLLKAGLGSAMALGLGSQLAPAAQAEAKPKRKAPEHVHLHFRLGHARGVTHLTLHGHASGSRSRATRRRRAARWPAKAGSGPRRTWARSHTMSATSSCRATGRWS